MSLLLAYKLKFNLKKKISEIHSFRQIYLKTQKNKTNASHILMVLKVMEYGFLINIMKNENIGIVINQQKHIMTDRKLKEIFNLLNAIKHLQLIRGDYSKVKEELVEDNEKSSLLGLMDLEECVLHLHKILMTGLLSIEKCGYVSTNVRCTQIKNDWYFYPLLNSNQDGENRILKILDIYNFTLTHKILTHQSQEAELEQIFKLTAWFILEMLSLHPFADGNGRLTRLLASYILSVLMPFPTLLLGNLERAIIHDRKRSGNQPPIYLVKLIIKSTWLSWKIFFNLLTKK
ncbi:Ribonucleoside-diphosphate reductase small chain [Astathelohania contejeani]|uniref:Ribonucleoside-diphosphate reductase small chain n=1 Tax=Astathelohania contejeani TaxID=164912 RepID=A0ABQ7HWG1_9MICR|nr:Ribonucleoside-diphosphate reductase small chain [Thelohania contejeani]